MPPRGSSSGGQNPEFVLREFQGMNLTAGRESIGDDEFFWCENAIPVAGAALYPVNGASNALQTLAETGAPTYSVQFNASGADFAFAVWKNSGHGWIVNLVTFVGTQIITGLTSGQTSATQYNNQGLLIIDPTGYWDWNITTPNTLTPQNDALANATLVYSNRIPGGTQLKNTGVIAGGPGSGATVQTTWTVSLVAINAAGTGYQVGDSLTLTDGSPTTPANIIVSTVGGGGTITGITLATGGSYPGPPTSSLVAVGPTGTVVTGGSGSTATFVVTMTTLGINILNRGSGYSGFPLYSDLISTNVDQNVFQITSSGVIGGTQIATYAGRVWIALARTVYFTDINSYNSFGGVGGSFTINDAYLHDDITVLFSANNYLYIFGDTSIDALSNVTVNLGVTSFSRINLTGSVGSSVPTSVFSYYRAIVFYHSSGFYLLSGATPERISEKISSLISQIASNSSGFPLVYGCQVLVKGELCIAMNFTFTDIFTVSGANRSLIALYFRGRWWVASLLGLNVQALISIPSLVVGSLTIAGAATAYAWAGPSLYRAFDVSILISNWLIKTKLWDAGSPLTEKQSINAALACNFTGITGTGVTASVDTEKVSFPPTFSMIPNGVPSGYAIDVVLANQGGSQYLGLTIAGGVEVSKIRLAALRAKADRDFMQ